MPEPTPRSTPIPTPGRGPSREMLGGPVLGVLVFLLVAVLMVWGLTSLIGLQLDAGVRDAKSAKIEHRFDPSRVYVLQRGLLLGLTSDRQVVVFPARDDLPRDAPHRRRVPTIADYRAQPDQHPDLLGVVTPGTRVRFTRLVHDAHHRQTPILAGVLILDGEHEGTQATGLHLELEEQAHTGDDAQLLVPRPDLFLAEAGPPEAAEAVTQPIQSPSPPAPGPAEPTAPTTPQ